VKRPLGEWLQSGNEPETARLDAIRRSVLASERPSVAELLAELFRPHARAWGCILTAWVLLALAHLFANGKSAPAGSHRLQEPSANLAILSPDEALSPLDWHS
jgi:hypothetical protein